MDYNKLAKSIIADIGGSDNVSSAFHCVTRVRFVLKDDQKADQKAIENLDGVMDVVKQAGQFQVVIGAQVAEVFDAIVQEGNFSSAVLGESKEPTANDKDENIFNRFMNLISTIFAPVLGILTASGMIKAILSLFTVAGWMSEKSGTYIILSAMGDALFYFFPVALGWSSAKKFGLKELYGITLGGILVYPTLVTAASSKTLYTLFKGTMFAMPVKLNFHGLPVVMQTYSTTVIPIILIVWVASYIYRWLNKALPAMLRAFFVPFFTILVAAPLGLLFVGPIAVFLQDILSKLVIWLVGLNAGIAGLLLGAFWSVLVMFGLHWAVIPFFAINVAQYGYDVINPLIFAGALASMGSVLGVIIRTKSVKERSIAIPAFISSFFGINEPSLYGVLIPRKKIMWTSFLGAGIGGAIAGFSHSKLYAFGASGPLGLPCFINPKGIDMGFIGLCIGGVVAFVFALVTALAFGSKKDMEISADTEQKTKSGIADHEEVYSPVKGESFDLTTVNDDVFANLTLGDGIAIKPEKGRVYSPVDGIIRVAYPTNHAIGIASNNGTEILIHIGINTVDLNGKYFTGHVTQGMRVHRGDLLVEFDLYKLQESGYDSTVMVVVTKSEELKAVMPISYGKTNNQTPILDVSLKTKEDILENSASKGVI